ncbi:hypothetical protein CCACVL1_16544 [Corchorus capsularis]|uniref:Uncharacterized protein n=1 Tax=Corchorus capsularis TaxID=210143 RepID=A0A1R3HWG0_COCAP|nr:hypothetical protein CCACVL1_16544 [Corchorus capsularis]
MSSCKASKDDLEMRWIRRNKSSNDEELRSTICNYARDGWLSKRALADAFDVLNIINPDYAASKAIEQANGGYGINTKDDKELGKVVKYASTAPRSTN